MGVAIYQVDAFTDTPFRGNPAGVCILAEPASETWMKSIAREMNLSETAFLYPIPDGFSLRWFTPLVEVDLCGHATLASAHILYETGILQPDQIARFSTRSGWLTACLAGGWIEMDFPAKPVVESEAPSGLDEILGIRPIFSGKSQFDLLVEVATADEVRGAVPDFGKLKHFPARGVIVTAPSDCPDYDFVSRFFAPAVGVDEDPVTGSAHSTLTPFWAKKLGKNNLTGYQASKRGGILKLHARGDRVGISGQSVTIFTAQLNCLPD